MTARKPPEEQRKRGRPGHGDAEKAMAYQLWLEADKCSLRQLSELMAAKGTSVDVATLSRWKDLNPTWAALFAAKANPIDPAAIANALKRAKEDASKLEPEHFLGIKAQLVARLYTSICAMTFTDVDQWQRALESCEKIEALIHAERGKTISEHKTGRSASIMDAVAPNVTIAPFKKPNGNGSAA